MAPTGRPPKPTERKRALGNPGHRQLPSPVVALPRAIDLPEPIRPLAQFGRSMWDRTWQSGAVWVSEQTDIELLQMVCEQIDERMQLRLEVLRNGNRDDRRALRDLDKQIVSNLSYLGFTPTDRARLGVAEVRVQSTLETLRQARGK